MQKVINLLAIASTVVSAAVVGTGAYVYLNRASIIDGVKEQIMDQVTGALPGAIGGAMPGSTGGVLMDVPAASSPSPNSAAVPSGGLGVPNF